VNNQPEPARRDVEQALRLDPKLPSAWAIRGGVMQSAGQPREALADYLRALSYMPNDRAILWKVAELHRELNQPERSIQALQALTDTYAPGEEPSVELLYRLGEAELLAGHTAEAAEAARKAMARQPQHQPSRDLLERIELARQPQGTLR
jgi:Tfp pilus assembly protein PilF